LDSSSVYKILVNYGYISLFHCSHCTSDGNFANRGWKKKIQRRMSQMFGLTLLEFFNNIAELKPLWLNSKKAERGGRGRAS